MKKTVKIIVMALFVTLLLAGCGDKAPGQESVEISKLIKKEIRYDGEGNATDTYTYTYDENGHLLKEKYHHAYDGEERTMITEYTYDSDGNMTRNVCTEAGISNIVSYLYDESGKLIEMNSGEDGQDSRLTCEYDAYGNIICERLWFFGTLIETNYREYYEDGTMKRNETYKRKDTDSEEELNEISDYDENGNLILCVKYTQKNGETVPETRQEYEYSLEENTVTTTTYDAEGNVTDTKVRMLNVEFPEYDENGRLVSEKRYYGKTTGAEADFYYLFNYEYDKAGNMIKETCHSYYHDDNGKIKYWREYYY